MFKSVIFVTYDDMIPGRHYTHYMSVAMGLVPPSPLNIFMFRSFRPLTEDDVKDGKTFVGVVSYSERDGGIEVRHETEIADGAFMLP